MSKVKIAIAGINGRMGRFLAQTVANDEQAELVAATEFAGSSVIGCDAGELCGFGKIGVERIIYFLDKENVELEAEPAVELYVGVLGKEARAKAYQLVNELRMSGIIVETDYMDRSVKAQMKYANKLGAKHTVILGENELNSNAAKIKNMETGEQTEVALDAIAAYFTK